MNRKMTADQWDIIMSIKNNTFDCFWRERCGIDYNLSSEQKLSTLSNLAIDVFEKPEWQHLRETMLRRMDYTITKNGIRSFKIRKNLSLKQLLSCYISVIVCMKMVLPDKIIT